MYGCRFCLVQLDKCIYAVGGCNMDGSLSSVARYVEEADDWDYVCPMPMALRCLLCDFCFVFSVSAWEWDAVL